MKSSSVLIATTRRQFLVSVAALAGGVLVASPLKSSLTASTTTALPDLVVTDLIFPTYMKAGQALRFGVIVKNQGTVATPAGVEIGVGFYVDGTEASWSGTDVSSLAAGASTTLYANRGGVGGTGSWTATAGRHNLRATVNDAHRVAETTTTNNSKSAYFTIPAAVVAAKPVNTVLPVISGTAVVGDVLTSSTGTWN
jgi:subtilase family serine protease